MSSPATGEIMFDEQPVPNDAPLSPFRSRAFMRSAGFSLVAILSVTLLLAWAPQGWAICVPTVYSVTSSAPPPSANWTDTSGALWVPTGGFPGCAPGDSASDTNATPTTIVINSAIPNPIISLNLACNGCVIDVQSGGLLTLAGPASIGSGATLKVSGGTLEVANGGNLTFQSGSSFQLTGGTVDVQTNGMITTTGVSTISSLATLKLSGGTLVIPGGASLGLQSAAALNLLNGTVNGTGSISAGGTVQTLPGNSNSTINTILNVIPGGNVYGGAGNMSITSGGNGDGPFFIAGGAVVDFPSGTYTLTTNGTVNGPGSLSLTGATLVIGGVTTPGIFVFTGGILDGPGFLHIDSSFLWSGGVMKGSGGAELRGGGTGTWDGTNPMVLDGRSFDVNGTVTLTATPISASLLMQSGAVLKVFGTFYMDGDASVTCDCTIPPSMEIQPNGYLFKTAAGTSTIATPFLNASNVEAVDGILSILGNGNHTGTFYTDAGATLRFGAASTTSNGPIFGQGTVEFVGFGSNTIQGYSVGTTTITNAYVDYNQDATTGGFNFSGGEMTLEDITFEMTGTGTWTGGTMDGFGAFHLTDTLTIDASNNSPTIDSIELVNDGTITYQGVNGPVDVKKPAVTAAGGRDLSPLTIHRPASSAFFSSALALQNTALLSNYGLFEIRTDLPIVSAAPVSGSSIAPVASAKSRPARKEHGVRVRPHADHPDIRVSCSCTSNFFDNLGTLRKVSDVGTTDFGPVLTNYGSVEAANGVLNFLDTYTQLSGNTTLGPGNIQVSSPLALNGGVLDGSGTITGDLVNAGTVSPEAVPLVTGLRVGTASTGSGPAHRLTPSSNPNTIGTINVTGNYSQTSSGTLQIDIDGATSADQLVVGGTTTLDGTLSVALLNSYVPANGTTWQAVTSTGIVNGTFASYTPATFPPNGTIVVSYTPNSVVLTAVAPPLADLSVTKTGPASVLAGQNIVYTVTVTNNGPAAATAVNVADPTPASLTFVSNSGACTNPYPCSLGTLNANQTVTITSTYSTPPTFTGSVTNTATASTTSPDSNSANDSGSATTAVGAQADLSVAKSGPASVLKGQNIVYTVTVSNAGPLAATSVVVTDATPAGLTFVSNSGACATPYPCSLGTITAGQTVSITSTYNVPSGYTPASITNTAAVSSTTADLNSTNDAASFTTSVASPSSADLSIVKTGAATLDSSGVAHFTIVVQNNGPGTATGVVVTDPTPSGSTFLGATGGCTWFPCNLGNMTSGQSVTINSNYAVASGQTIINSASVSGTSTDPVTANNQSSASIGPVSNCPLSGPQLASPAQGSVESSQVTFAWTPFAGATSYILFVTGPATNLQMTVTSTTVTLTLPNGAYRWSVQPVGGACLPIGSVTGSFSVCTPVSATVASAVAESTSGQTYALQWTEVGAASYEVQEALDSTFTNPTVSTVATSSKLFTKILTVATAFYYRVRPISACGQNGEFSNVVPVAVVPIPPPDGGVVSINIPNLTGSTVTFQIFVPGLPGGTTSFVASVDKTWLAVTPNSGVIPPEGLFLTLSADPAGLTVGTWTGTVLVAYGTSTVGKTAVDAAAPVKAVPVSINVVTPVSPALISNPASNAVVIPTVGHLAGLSSNWRSDIRIANVSTQTAAYQLVLNTGDPSTAAKQTNISLEPGVTMALDDIVRKWFGIGSLGESANATLMITPLDATGKPSNTSGLSKANVVSSRTYNASVTSATGGTLGQFIPAVPFANFIGSSGAAKSILALQQIAQTADYRTNLGIVEATGKSASVVVDVFDGAGSKVLSLPVNVPGGQQVQLNSFLAQKNISLSNGHVEVQVTSGEGRVTTYASVIDNRTNDPLLVSGVALGGLGASRFVVPGVADLNTGAANWRSDLRVFNGGAAPQNASLTFFPLGAGTTATTKDLAIAPGEVKAVDDVLRSLFGVSNAGGALHVTTAVSSPLVVSARTYDLTATGTLGQYIPAITPNDAVGSSDRALQILQVEESPRYRTNVGIAEVTGKPAVAEISVVLPDSKVSPRVQLSLGAFESRQFPLLNSLGLGNVYNGRISVKIISGDGKVTAYGSVVDMTTQDPTYVPAQ
jgi:uncharacterized repeat protein (TIGR01451 family)